MSDTQSPFPSLEKFREDGFSYFNVSELFDVSISFLDPNLRLAAHTHELDVYAQVLTGELTLIRDDRRETYGAQEWFRIPAGQVHAVEVTQAVSLLELWRKPGSAT